MYEASVEPSFMPNSESAMPVTFEQDLSVVTPNASTLIDSDRAPEVDAMDDDMPEAADPGCLDEGRPEK